MSSGFAARGGIPAVLTAAVTRLSPERPWPTNPHTPGPPGVTLGSL